MPLLAPVLVTGAAGFVGRWMVRRLLEEGIDVVATARRATGETRGLDLLEPDEVHKIVKSVGPRTVIHLAGKTYLPWVLAHQKESFRANVFGTANLMEAVRTHAATARVLLTSSCTVYGEAKPEDLPLHEGSPLAALHPYAVQKIGMEVLAEDYATRSGLDVVVARPFNHIGPGMSRDISAAHFATMIARHEVGLGSAVLRVGNLEARRDFLDVRDVVEAYMLLLKCPQPPRIVNVASGRSVRIGEILDTLIKLSPSAFRVETDPLRMRPLDTPELVGDARLLTQSVGFVPHIPLEKTLKDILDEARTLVAG
ncbi:MAG TPA: GDP-mannose 4,6-dehydratase, partial [Planctomycetota bacterium]|nr:GDP-mannose 4,6-dehydratase [Planctomycetota bacterium]